MIDHNYDGPEWTREAEGPDEGDYAVETTGRGLSVSEVGGKFLGMARDWDEAETMIRNHQRGSNFYPSVWNVSDHGNAHLVGDWKW